MTMIYDITWDQVWCPWSALPLGAKLCLWFYYHWRPCRWLLLRAILVFVVHASTRGHVRFVLCVATSSMFSCSSQRPCGKFVVHSATEIMFIFVIHAVVVMLSMVCPTTRDPQELHHLCGTWRVHDAHNPCSFRELCRSP